MTFGAMTRHKPCAVFFLSRFARIAPCVVALFFLLTACTQQPAKVVYGGGDMSTDLLGRRATRLKSSLQISPDALPKKGVVKDGRTVTVRRGDTVYDLAKRHHVTSRDIIYANGLAPPYRLKAGQKLKVPAYRYHKVRAGETLYKISRGYNVDMNSLVEANAIKRPYPINPGQWLIIPGANSESKAFKAQRALKGPAPRKVTARGKKPAMKQVALSRKKPSSVTPARDYGVYASASGRGKFGWPVRGSVIAGFGPQKAGVYNDGINIRTQEGEKVIASEEGEVVYTGKGLKGYGNMLIISHKNGYITAYAHNREVVVQKGQRVKRGQVVAFAGATGNVDSPQLHFAIRKGKKALDPLHYLAG